MITVVVHSAGHGSSLTGRIPGRRADRPGQAYRQTPAHVAQWLRRGRVGPTACIPIETAVGGQVTRYELRPDVFGKPPQLQPGEAPR